MIALTFGVGLGLGFAQATREKKAGRAEALPLPDASCDAASTPFWRGTAKVSRPIRGRIA